MGEAGHGCANLQPGSCKRFSGVLAQWGDCVVCGVYFEMLDKEMQASFTILTIASVKKVCILEELCMFNLI